MIVMNNRYAPGRRGWNLRIGLTSRCNIRWTFEDLVEVLRASYEVGIRRVHYTGGEPTVRRDFLDILKAATEIGFTQQIVTTNGYRLHHFIEKAIGNGLTRAIISLDTLDEQQNCSSPAPTSSRTPCAVSNVRSSCYRP